MKKQHGGTILGFVIGVVVGLGAALAVAVYVTKVPIPFVSKGQSRSADQDAAELKKNKDWDPNTPLYGKNPIKPVVPAAPAPVAPSAGPVAATAPVPAAKPSPDAAAVAAAAKNGGKPAVSTDPLGDLAKARAANAAAEPFSYFVQVGAFRTPEDAESQRAKLSLGGVEAKVTEREQSGRVVYRVRVGPFDRKEEADKTKEKLEAAGMETALVRVQR
ncbi:SPOR domain-containing protein [Rhodoferax ferrireducens]|uniref:SPOR domain-containing protein n=1 Tax=Rhodoferax ferrireducens TaxID=192843 RepID=UPI000E0DC93B|nr:SPOR domain-containing protein [Rhodoferax ferrireducens]